MAWSGGVKEEEWDEEMHEEQEKDGEKMQGMFGEEEMEEVREAVVRGGSGGGGVTETSARRRGRDSPVLQKVAVLLARVCSHTRLVPAPRPLWPCLAPHTQKLAAAAAAAAELVAVVAVIVEVEGGSSRASSQQFVCKWLCVNIRVCVCVEEEEEEEEEEEKEKEKEEAFPAHVPRFRFSDWLCLPGSTLLSHPPPLSLSFPLLSTLLCSSPCLTRVNRGCLVFVMVVVVVVIVVVVV
ncbi:hypothetical protein E2C01_086066 [Portunus trituberculatus]|uniref:Uncharacterized protein n=1 Tax=Portunus trituberculatus TaxID=210409 RepID=A0A5B7J9A0_PORTR|nr:hypothetical protein [Portunus trituberculatus]